jgi:hypothetical protein
MKGTLILGIAFLVFAGLLITSPYWLVRELNRSDDEQLPAWMGDARARKRRLIWISGIFVTLGGGGLIILSIVNP